jgi:hypothetical protein
MVDQIQSITERNDPKARDQSQRGGEVQEERFSGREGPAIIMSGGAGLLGVSCVGRGARVQVLFFDDVHGSLQETLEPRTLVSQKKEQKTKEQTNVLLISNFFFCCRKQRTDCILNCILNCIELWKIWRHVF